MRLSNLFLSLFIIASVAACNGFLNGNNSDRAKLHFTTNHAVSVGSKVTFNGDTLIFKPFNLSGPDNPNYRDHDNLPPFTSQINNHQVVIHGYYLAPSPFIPAGNIHQKGSVITISVHPPETHGKSTSPSMPMGLFYDAYITNLNAGTYTVKILHQNDGLRASRNRPPDEKVMVFNKKFVIK